MSGRSGQVRRRGVAMVEMALVLPLLALLVFGLIEYGMTFYVLHGMTNAARDAVRQLAIRGATEQQAVDVARDRLSYFDPHVMHFTVTATQPPGPGGSRECTVHISVPKSDVSLGISFIPTGTSNKLETEVKMRKEGD